MNQNPRIILTRQRERNQAWAQALTAAGLAVYELPLIRFQSFSVAADLGAFDWILFTSPQAVRAFQESGLASGSARIGALGPGTAAALGAMDQPVDFQPGLKDGVEFATAFVHHTSAPASVLLPGPERRMREPVAILTQAGFLVRELALYRTVPIPREELPTSPFDPEDVVFFCSPSTVRAFCDAWEQRPQCIAIGETTAAAARAEGFAPRVAATPDLQAMIQALDLDLDLKTLSPESMS